MSDTPETDAEEDASHNFAELVVPSSLARTLERERDEAMAERDILRLDAQREAEHHDRLVKELESLYEKNAKLRDISDGFLIALERATKYLPEYSRVNYEDALWRLRKKLEEETK